MFPIIHRNCSLIRPAIHNADSQWCKASSHLITIEEIIIASATHLTPRRLTFALTVCTIKHNSFIPKPQQDITDERSMQYLLYTVFDGRMTVCSLFCSISGQA